MRGSAFPRECRPFFRFGPIFISTVEVKVEFLVRYAAFGYNLSVMNPFQFLRIPFILVSVSSFAVAQASAPAPAIDGYDPGLTGKWELKSFTCEGGTSDSIVRMNEARVSEGRTREMLTIAPAEVRFHWSNSGKEGSCDSERSQHWEFRQGIYRITADRVVKETGKCPPVNTVSGVGRTFRLKGNELRIVVSAAQPSPSGGSRGAIVPCKGGEWIRTYVRIP